MRGLILLAALSVTLIHAAWNGYIEERNSDPTTDSGDVLRIDAGAGDPGAGSGSVRYAALHDFVDYDENE